MDSIITGFPRQALPRSKKTKEWCKKCIKAADDNSVISSSMIRRTVAHKKINYDLMSGKLDMKDLEVSVNPEGFELGIPTAKIQHYPIINKQIFLMLGEERAGQFDFKVTVTNPNALSEIEQEKKAEFKQKLQALIEDNNLSAEDYQENAERLSKYFTYDYQDLRELRANCLLNHYKKELNFDEIWNDGFVDVMINNEEIYQIYIEGGEPRARKLNPLKVHCWGAGSSNKVEDCNYIVIEDYVDIGRIIDMYHDELTPAQVKQLESLQYGKEDITQGKVDPRYFFKFGNHEDQIVDFNDEFINFIDGIDSAALPYDMNGNVRVLQVYWKSLRKVQRVKFYDKETGNVDFTYKTEDYIPDKSKGETAETRFINEAWHGVMIGSGDDAIYVDLGPCKVQTNSMGNPSRCHFGIIGTIYNFNEGRPYSMVDMMKPYQYMYDVLWDQLRRLIARNAGKVIQLNLSMVPDGWKVEKFLSFIKNYGVAVVDPMKEGTAPVSKGKMAGMFNVSPVIDMELSASIQAMMNMLVYIYQQISEITGITPQRLGAVQNRETVGGIERSNLQSSHVTRWYFAKHDDTKKRFLECFLEYVKAALKGKNKKFDYILPDVSKILVDIDGDDFCECDYGIVVDNSYDMQSMNQEIQQIAQAAMQNQALTFSAYLKLRSNCSMAEKIKILEQTEQMLQQQQQQQQQQAMQKQQQMAEQQAMKDQMEMQYKQQEIQLKDTMNQRDNETKLMVAQLNAANSEPIETDTTEADRKFELDQQKTDEMIREFDEKMKLERDKLKQDKEKHDADIKVKQQSLNKKSNTK